MIKILAILILVFVKAVAPCYTLDIKVSDGTGIINIEEKPSYTDVTFRQDDSGYVIRGTSPTYSANLAEGEYLVYLTSKDSRAFRISEIYTVSISNNKDYLVTFSVCD